jgi:hypothetical protein
MTDHEILMGLVIWTIVFTLADFRWKVFGTQERLDRIEKKLGIKR